MQVAYIGICLGIILINSAVTSAEYWRRGRTWTWPGHHREDCRHEEQRRPADYGSFQEGHTCSCLLMVSNTMVFRRDDKTGWYSCSGWGLHRCEQYCTAMFQNEGLRSQSRQEACDILGYEIYSPWYRRNQVCGYNGRYMDKQLQVDLCCRRGRPSEKCQEEAQT